MTFGTYGMFIIFDHFFLLYQIILKMPRSKRARSYTNSQSGKTYKRKYTLQPYKPRIQRSKISNLRNDTYKFTRMCNLGDIGPGTNATGTGVLTGAIAFKFDDMPNFNDFTSLFDRYRITHVQLSFYLAYSPDSGVANTDVNNTGMATMSMHPILYLIKDYDDSNVPTSMDVIREHNKVAVFPLSADKITKYNVKPAVNSIVYRSTTSSSYTPAWKQWIDMVTTDTPHYGVKYGVENFFGKYQYIRVRAKFWFECKDVR